MADRPAIVIYPGVGVLVIKNISITTQPLVEDVYKDGKRDDAPIDVRFVGTRVTVFGEGASEEELDPEILEDVRKLREQHERK